MAKGMLFLGVGFRNVFLAVTSGRDIEKATMCSG